MAPRPEISRQEAVAAQALLAGLTGLSSRAGHDLVGPLNQAASLLALFIKRYGSRLDPDADKLLEFLQRSSTRMEEVAAGVRKYMEIAGRPPSFAPVDLNTSLACSLSLLEEAISESGAVVVSDSLPAVSADAAHMVTMFEILIGNSIKFRRPDTPPRIQVISRPASDFNLIAIADNGIGIDPESREAVFLPFHRLHGKEYSGSGLGLAAAKLIAEMQGGNVRISPVPDCEPSHNRTQVEFTVRSVQAK
jgi:light-regulated signal transduction histidine kinase (bacteriophytochrome)